MRPFIKTEALDGFTRTMALTAVTDRETAAARRLFERARDTGIILNASFDDSVWKLTDEVRTCSIRFLPDEVLIVKEN